MRKGTGIFINYRRRDAAGHAGRLFDWLAVRRGAAHVFMDVSGIQLGGDFAQLIDAALRRCEVVLVLIGPGWMASLDARRDDPQDWVRIEIERALELEVRIIPVLVGGAALPAAAQLPAALAPLVGLQSIELSDSKWESDRELLWQAVKPVRHWQLPPRERIRTGVFWAALVVLVPALWFAIGPDVASKLTALGPLRPAAAPALDAAQYAQMHGGSPLVIRSLLTLLREHGVPATQLEPRLEASVELHQILDIRFFGDIHHHHLSGGQSRGAQAAQAEFDKSWKAAHRLFKEGRYDETKSTLRMAIDQRVGGRNPASFDAVTASEMTWAYWTLGEIERLTLSPVAAAEQYAKAVRLSQLPSLAASSRKSLSIDIQGSWARMLFEQSDFAAAESKYRENLKLVQQLAPDETFTAIEMLRGIASTLEARSRYAEAAPLRAQALELAVRDGNDGRHSTVERVREYANTLRKTGRDSEARELLERFALSPNRP